VVWSGGISTAQEHYEDLEYPPIEDLQVPDAERVTLDNGLVVYLLEDDELPLVEFRARIGTGSVYEPAEKAGLADLTGTVMRTGGTANRSGDAINRLLERIAASVETDIGTTSGTASASSLKDHVDTTLAVLADILRRPTFAQEKIEVAKTDMRSNISRRNDDPQQVAFREFRHLVYGKDSPYSRQPEYATVDAITREDLIDFHDRFFQPNNVILGVWGDFETEEMVEKLRSTLGDWEPMEVHLPEPPPVEASSGSAVNFIPKSDVNQSVIMMGHLGGQRDNPDYFALQVMNNILGGGFASRLFRNVRAEKGLAYAVFGQYGANYDYPGIFYAGSMTRSEATVEAVRAVRHEVESMLEDPVTEEELAQAKESFLNSFVFNFDSRGEIVNRLLTYEYYDYPRDFLQQIRDGIEEVTREDVQRVARQYLKVDSMQTLVVGNRDDFDTPLSELGEVNEIEITIPTPGEEDVPEATDVSLAEGRSLLNEAVEALGGKAAFEELSTLQQEQTVTLSTAQGQRELDTDMQIMLPDRLRIDVQTPGGRMTQIVDGETAHIVTPKGTRQAPSSQVQQLTSTLWRELPYLFARMDAEELSVQHLGTEELDGQTVDVLRLRPPGEAKSFRMFLEPESKRPVMLQFEGTTREGAPAETRQELQDYREVDGLWLPHTVVVYREGSEVQRSTISSYQINPSIDESRFTAE
jgi:predicted Zn-dependent peptidase/outer membrane lipoprotein-sorting protein